MVAGPFSSPGTTRRRRSNGSLSTFDVNARDENELAYSANRDTSDASDAMTMTKASLAAYAANATERLRNARRTSGRGGRTVPTSDSTMGNSAMASARGRRRSSAGDSTTTVCSGFAMRDGKTGSVGRDGPRIPPSVSTIISRGSPASDPDDRFMRSHRPGGQFSRNGGQLGDSMAELTKEDSSRMLQKNTFFNTADRQQSGRISLATTSGGSAAAFRRRGRTGGGRRSSKFAERKEGPREIYAEPNHLCKQANGIESGKHRGRLGPATAKGGVASGLGSPMINGITTTSRRRSKSGGAAESFLSQHTIIERTKDVHGLGTTVSSGQDSAFCASGSRADHQRSRSKSSDFSRRQYAHQIGSNGHVNNVRLAKSEAELFNKSDFNRRQDAHQIGSSGNFKNGRLSRSEVDLFNKSNTTLSFGDLCSPKSNNRMPMSPTGRLNESDANLTFCGPCSQQPSRNDRKEAPLCQPCSPRADGAAKEDETRWELEESMGSLGRPSSKTIERMNDGPRNMSHASSNQNRRAPVPPPAPRMRRPDPPPCTRPCNDARFMIRRTQSAPFDIPPSNPSKIFSPPTSPAIRTPDRAALPRHAGQGVSSGTHANRSLGQSRPPRQRLLISNSHVNDSTSPRGKGVEELHRSSTIYGSDGHRFDPNIGDSNRPQAKGGRNCRARRTLVGPSIGDGHCATSDGQRVRQHSGEGYRLGQTLADRSHSIKFASDFQASILLTKLPIHSPLFVRRTSGEWTYAKLTGRLSDGQGETSLVVILDAHGDTKKVLERFWWKKCLRLVNQNAIDASMSTRATDSSFSNASRTSTNAGLIRKSSTPEPGGRSSSSDESNRFSGADIINRTAVPASERSLRRTKSAPGLEAMPPEPARLRSGVAATLDDASPGGGPSPAPNGTMSTGKILSRDAAASNANGKAVCNSYLQSYSVPTKGGTNEATTSTTGTKAAGKPTRDQPGEISPDTVTVNLHARHCTSRRDRMRPMRRGSSGSGLLSLGSLGGGSGGDGVGGYDGLSSSSGASRGGGGGGDDDAPDDATCAPVVDVEGGSTWGSCSSLDASSESTERASAPPPPPYGSGSGGSSSGDSAGQGSLALGGGPARMRLRGVDP